MQTVILSGGLGTRLRAVVSDLPKPMAPIKGKPFLEYLLLYLREAGLNEIILAVGYMSHKIVDYFGDGAEWGVKISYSVEDSPLGTGGALKRGCGLVEEWPILVLNGDSFAKVDINQMVRFHKGQHAVATIALTKVEDTGRYGRIEIDPEGRIIAFMEKNEGREGLINAGVYVVEKAFIDRIPEGMVSLERDVFPSLINKGLYGFTSEGFFIDIGIPQDYLSLINNPQGLQLTYLDAK